MLHQCRSCKRGIVSDCNRKSSKIKDAPDIVGGIEFNELPAIAALAQKIDSFFLNRVSNLFEDQAFTVEEVEQAREHLHPLLMEQLKPEEKAMLHKLLAALSYASAKKQPLFGIAD